MTDEQAQKQAEQWPIKVWRDKVPDPECGNCHWIAVADKWERTIDDTGKVRGCAPCTEGETLQEAVDLLHREMADFFKADWRPCEASSVYDHSK